MVNACLIGAGRMGRDHAKFIHYSADGKLYCVADANFNTAREVADKFGIKAYPSAEEALADPNVDAVVIASSTATHADLIQLSAKFGKPVFCEKPIDLTLEKIDQCLKVVKEAGVPLLVGFNRRFDPSFQELKRRIDLGEIGKIEMLSISSRDHYLPDHNYLKTSGFLFRDMMIHDFDMARWLLGEEPETVYTSGSCLVDPSIESFGDLDTAMVVLRTAKGALCHINNSRRAVYGYDQRIEAFGSEGMLRAHNLSPTTVELATKNGVTTDKPHPSFPQRYAQAYQNEMNHFFTDVVKAGKKPLIGGEDGRRALVIAEAVDKSYRTKQPVGI